MKITYERGFWTDPEDERSCVFQVFPQIYGDNRGDFCEVLKDMGEWSENKDYPLWFSNLSWIRQMNRSKSSSGVIRGCHAQRGRFCQGKLVEAINSRIYDIITDARPDSKTFGTSSVFLLDHNKQNKVWIPRGFLHAFVVPFENTEEKAIFNYCVDNTYDNGSEIGIDPRGVIPGIVSAQRETCPTEDFKPLYDMFSEDSRENIIYSEKDIGGLDYEDFMSDVYGNYVENGKLWYK